MEPTLRYLSRRVVFALVAVWAVVTIVFLLVAMTPDPYLAELLYYKTKHTRGNVSAAVTQLQTSYMTARGLHQPLWARYRDWLIGVATFDWGRSFTTGAPVSAMVKSYSLRSAMYVLPAVAVSSVLGALIGLYSAANRYSLPDRLTSLLAYLGMGIPNFWLAAVALIFVGGGQVGDINVFLNDPSVPLTKYVLPAVVLSTVLLGNHIHFARAEVHEQLNETFVDVLRAKGLSKLQVARQVLRNAALPLFAVVFADLFSVLILHIFVIETVFGISGLGRMAFLAIDTRDLPLILGFTMVAVIIGIFGNLFKDVLFLVADPRTDARTE